MLTELIILHRGLGCNDENASDSEQAEKILYYYPSNNGVDRLKRLNMLEGLLDFTGQFVRDGCIETVIMKRSTIGFLLMEENIWMIASYDNTKAVSDISDEIDSKQGVYTPNPAGLTDIMIRIYRLFTTFHGNISGIIDKKPSYRTTIEEIKHLRKSIRKLKFREMQEDQDYNTIRNDEGNEDADRIGIKANAKTLQELEHERDLTKIAIMEQESKLVALLQSPDYPLPLVYRLFDTFISWYIACGEVAAPSLLHGMGGINYYPVGHPTFQYLLRLRQAIYESSKRLAEKCIIINNGFVIWSDIDDETTFLIYEYIKLNEFAHLRNTLKHKFSSQGQDELSLKPAPGSTSDEALLKLEEEWYNEVMLEKGYLNDKWECVDLEEEIGFNTDDSNSNSAVDATLESASFMSPSSTDRIWRPSVYMQDITHKNNTVASDFRLNMGKMVLQHQAIVYKQHKTIVVMLLPHEECACSKAALQFYGTIQVSITSDVANLNNCMNGNYDSLDLKSSSALGSDRAERRRSVVPTENTRIIYFNKVNRALKLVDMYRFKVEPLSLWPQQLMRNMKNNGINQLLFSLLSDARPKFPHSPSLISSKLEVSILRALNNVRESLAGYQTTKLSEACVKVSNSYHGGVWVIGKKLGSRYLFMIVEGKTSFNDAYDQLLHTTGPEGILSAIIIS